jgi:hypothetical protein
MVWVGADWVKVLALGCVLMMFLFLYHELYEDTMGIYAFDEACGEKVLAGWLAMRRRGRDACHAV